ncbi:hypothetical protein [Niallia circulans]|uniref:hypothetical protein n=1 Tax=Niallia circulans TaxID=1397 RepID=UPI0026EDBBB9|nr:hypothetical protein [Niallia circulans]
MTELQNKVDKVLFTKGKVMGKVAPHGMDAVLEEFNASYQEAVEADIEKAYSNVLANSCKDVNEHLTAMRLYHLVNTMFINI